MNINKKIVSFILLPILSACSPQASLTPDNEYLSDATVGKPYFSEIRITGGRVITSTDWFPGIVEPKDSGLDLKNCRLPQWKITEKTRAPYNANCIQITGIPTATGLIKINISGMLHGGMLTGPGAFEKTYMIQVVESKE